MANNNREWKENPDNGFNKDYAKLPKIANDNNLINSKILILNRLKDD